MATVTDTFGFHHVRDRLRERFRGWVNRRIPPARRILLNHQNIFILPNRQGMGFLVVLALMLIGAINYEASLAFALSFLLMGLFLTSIFHTFRNLSGLQVSAVAGRSVFAGENAEITVILDRAGEREYESIHLGFPSTDRASADLIDDREIRVELYAPVTRRGRFSPGRLCIETVFPFGICRAWSLVDLQVACLVFPRPIPCDLEWLLSTQQQAGHIRMNTGNEDFYALREYQRGDSLRHVAWKNFARGQGLLTKQFSSNLDERVWLDWEMFPDLDMENRLSRLCFCVLQLDQSGMDYGLRLPGIEIAPDKGAVHYQRVLEKLALYGLEEEGEA